MATAKAITWRNRKTGFANKAFKFNGSLTEIDAEKETGVVFDKIELLAAFRDQFGLWINGVEIGRCTTKFYVHSPKSRSPGSRTVAFRTPNFVRDAIVDYDKSGRVGVAGPVVFKPYSLRYRKRSSR
jgi:hypothetical protein